ncbi:MAG: ABC transporter permease [Myxococcales bacterium]|nr:ABC transporter permease [Myxococcales bacterium]
MIARTILPAIRLEVRRLRRSPRTGIALALALTVTAVAVAVLLAGSSPDFAEAAQLSIFSVLVFLVPYIFTSGILSDEVAARTLPFLLVRPIGRRAIILAKFITGTLASWAALSGAFVVLLVGAAIGSPAMPEPPTVLACLLAMITLATVYAAVCTLWATVAPEASAMGSALHLFILEFALAKAPGAMRLPSMNYMAGRLAGFEPGGFFADRAPDVGATTAFLIMLGAAAVFLGVALVVVPSREYRLGRGH